MKNHSCLHAVFVLALAMLFFACTSPPLRGLGGLGWGALKPGGVFSQADSLMNHRPDSALQLLETLLPDTNSMRKGDLMRFHLLRTNAQNKCDTVFRALIWAVKRYDIVGVNEWNKNFNFKNTGYSPSLLSRPIQ